MRIFSFLPLLLLGTTVTAQQTPAPERNYSHAQASQDLQALMQAMREAQTGIYRYISVKEFDKKFKAGLQSFNDSVSYRQLYQQAAALISVTGCSHSGISHAQYYQQYLNESARFFPLSIAVTRRRYYIKQNSDNDSTIRAGSRLISINGQRLSHIAKIFARYIDREGNNHTHLYREMENDFSGMYADFIGLPTQFRVVLRPPGKQHVKKVTVDAGPKSKLYAAPEGKKLPLAFRYLDSLSAGIFTISSFNEHVIASRGQHFTLFTDSVFSILREHKAAHLVIDLRGNRGGSTAYSKNLFAYFINQSYPYIQKIEVAKRDNYSFSTLVTSPSKYNDTMQFLGMNGYWRWMNNPNLTVIPQNDNRFTAKIYILIDGNTMSAAAFFATAMRERTQAIFVGEETGGATGGLNGLPINLQLPNSKINITLSTAKYTFTTSAKNKTHGVFPNIAVQQTVEDIIAKRDTVMDTILYHIQSE